MPRCWRWPRRAHDVKGGGGVAARDGVCEPRLVVEPLVECLVAGAGRVERAGADEDDRRLRIPESYLRPAERLGESFAWAVGAAVGLGDRAPMQALERVRAEELQVLLALAHAVGNDAEWWGSLRPAMGDGVATQTRGLSTPGPLKILPMATIPAIDVKELRRRLEAGGATPYLLDVRV